MTVALGIAMAAHSPRTAPQEAAFALAPAEVAADLQAVDLFDEEMRRRLLALNSVRNAASVAPSAHRSLHWAHAPQPFTPEKLRMAQATLNLPMTAAEFLVWDAAQSVKHEFVRGDMFAMTGAADAHVTVAGNIYSLLRRHLKDSTCSASDAAESLVKREPVLIVKVLSPPTAACDRGAKFVAYRQLQSARRGGLSSGALRRGQRPVSAASPCPVAWRLWRRR